MLKSKAWYNATQFRLVSDNPTRGFRHNGVIIQRLVKGKDNVVTVIAYSSPMTSLKHHGIDAITSNSTFCLSSPKEIDVHCGWIVVMSIAFIQN